MIPHRWRMIGAALTLAVSSSIACNDRPLVPSPPGHVPDCCTYGRLLRPRVDKVDLLLVIDNSMSMADKQAELAKRMPELISSLTDDTPDPVTGQPASAVDLHVGVISSSLGSHGSSACAVSLTSASNDDRAHLLPRAGSSGGASGWVVRAPGAAPEAAPCPGTASASALSWVFDPARDPAARFRATDGLLTLQAATSCVVQSVEQTGCDYEETWEATYHFLIDPAPYAKAEVKCAFDAGGDQCGTNDIVVEGVDTDLLAQRAAFLRRDSLVAVIILSDENDASLRPAGKNWLPWTYGARAMLRGWEACESLSDDLEPDSSFELTSKGCFSCFQDNKNANCVRAWAMDKLNNDPDARSLRGFHQVQRFGFNFLWSRDRYVNAFKNAMVPGSDGRVGPNPLFSGGFRDPSLVLVAGIVGVPKGLVEDAGRPKDMTAADWEKVSGPVGKRDPHMIESIGPRAGVPNFAGARGIDPVHGGDRDVPAGDDLQYACIGRRAAGALGAGDCEGLGADAAKKNPLCDSSTAQSYFKAYPGLRHARILERLGASGVIASICNESFSPVVQGIVERIRAVLRLQCVWLTLAQDASGNVSCDLIEVFKGGTFAGKTCEAIGGGYCTPGAAPCRRKGDETFPPLERAEAALQLNLPITVVGKDGSPTRENVQARVDGDSIVAIGSDGEKHLVCEHKQLAGGRVDEATSNACISQKDFRLTKGGGFCYSTDPAIVGDCRKAGAASTLRFLGDSEPKSGSELFTVCIK